MKKTGLIIAATILFIFSGCSMRPGIVIDPKVEAEYLEVRSCYPAEYSNIFPNLRSGKLLSYHFGFPAEGRGLSPNHIYLLMEYPEDKMDSIRRYARQNKIIDYQFTDSCLLVIDYSADKIRHFKNFKCIPDTLNQNPISNFEFLQNIQGIGDYPEKATIYVLGWGRGPIIDKKYLRADRAGLPARWEHGFSKGVVIWDKYVAYWLDVW